MKQPISFLLWSSMLTACVSLEPYKEYALAQSSLLWAKQFSANKLFPKAYIKASLLYKKGASLYKEQSYDEARLSFEKSIKLAEKAELKARLKTLKETE